ncbi:GNAT family N-acetyltransferase [Microbacterium capsulatum]|uniref:GNAT family N-acetyltransferase n=1 Tax=Microbacterium capsulatum TaxID=3041921 RepID=A0ABU0XJI6_9MICO|nr:GNAT family N-acetyltransferase [Microbacterium sp. ASV81]MDQ4215288.1 GNAT family N-acetyltransferase [Microbacterium sp. ASV81]
MITLRPWQPEDRPLLDRFNTLEMTAHLVAQESDEELEKRHRRYLRTDLPGRMLVICDGDDAVGSIGYWETSEGADDAVWEAGWSVLPEFQGRGYAGQALAALLDVVRADGRHAEIHAYPSVDNTASNALCRRAGFTLRSARPFPFRGEEILSNDWALIL